MPSFPAASAVGAGLGVHFLNAAVYGVGFTAAVLSVPALRDHRAALVVVGLLFGLALWLINFYVIAPPAGWVWFPTQANPIQQFISHVFAFGTLLGVYLDRALGPRREAAPRPARA
jgi:hypothetical protein